MPAFFSSGASMTFENRLAFVKYEMLMVSELYSSGSPRSLPLIMAVLPQPAEPMSIIPNLFGSSWSSQKEMATVSMVGTVTTDILVVAESNASSGTTSDQGAKSFLALSMKTSKTSPRCGNLMTLKVSFQYCENFLR